MDPKHGIKKYHIVITYTCTSNKSPKGVDKSMNDSILEMDGRLAILCPFQQYFSHIRTMGG